MLSGFLSMRVVLLTLPTFLIKRTANHTDSLWLFIEYATVLLITDVTLKDTDTGVTAGSFAPPIDQLPSDCASSSTGPAQTSIQTVYKVKQLEQRPTEKAETKIGKPSNNVGKKTDKAT